MSERSYWGIVLTIIDAGIVGETEKARRYTELLEGNLRNDGDAALADRLKRILNGESKRNKFYLTQAPEYQQYEERIWCEVEQRWPEIKKLAKEAGDGR